MKAVKRLHLGLFLAAVCFLPAFAAHSSAAGQAQTPAAKPAGAPPQGSAAEKSGAAKPGSSRRPTQAGPDLGTVANGVYAEKFFNLRYTLPQGWTVRTEEMRKDLPAGADTLLLLSAFAHPQLQGSEVNSSITISAESAAQYKEGVDAEAYLAAVSDYAATKGFKVLNPPGEIEMGGVTFVRGDFVREAADTNTYQATLVTLRKGYILSVTAISGDEEQLTALLDRLRIFAPPALKKP